MAVIEVANLKKFFGKTKAVDAISFDVKKGEIMGFLGPNGSGKSTTVNCMMDNIRPLEGAVKILGLDAKESSSELKERIGYLSEEANLYQTWTGQEHINLVKHIRHKKIDESGIVNKLDFDPKKKVKSLSSGNRQKLGLILALMHEPEVIILDEPTRGLDPLLQQDIYELLSAQAKKGTTIFMSSHNLPEVEQVCDRVCIIKEGKIVAIEDVDQIRKKKIYTILLRFVEQIDKKAFMSPLIKIEEELEDGYILKASGDVQELLEKILKYKLKDLEIKHASLEEIFIEYYKTEK